MSSESPLQGVELVQKSVLIAQDAHKGQYRNDNITPYINHPYTVANRVLSKYMHLPLYDLSMLVSTALLHDVIEDSQWTSEMLLKDGIPEQVVEAVTLLTKQKDTSYITYLSSVNSNDIAKKVKIQDIVSNYLDNPSNKARAKYQMAAKILSFELPELPDNSITH